MLMAGLSRQRVIFMLGKCMQACYARQKVLKLKRQKKGSFGLQIIWDPSLTHIMLVDLCPPVVV